jgi:DNA-binding IclR family transcriptional regulator
MCERPVALGPTELGREHDLHLSTVLRLLGTLEQEGFVERLSSGKYQPSPQFVVGAGRWSHIAPGAIIVRMVLTRLAALTGETAFITVRSGLYRVVLEAVQSQHWLFVRADAGHASPLLEGPTGYALLEDLSSAQLAQIRRATSRQFPDRAVLTEAQGDSILRQIRKQGYSISSLEREPLSGSRVLAIPVRGSTGHVACSVGIVGPVDRWTNARIRKLLDGILSAVDDLECDARPEASSVRSQLTSGPVNTNAGVAAIGTLIDAQPQFQQTLRRAR